MRYIKFRKDNSLYFSYLPFSDCLLIPSDIQSEKEIRNFFIWVIDSISHEELHRIIAKEQSWIDSWGLDNLGYCFETGYNHKEQKGRK